MEFYIDFDKYLGSVIDSIKQLLYSRNADIFNRLDFDDDSIYLEPLLYTYVNQEDDKWLDCIIYGYEKEKKKSIDVFSNAEGVIYIPQIGYFKTGIPAATLILESNDNGIILLYDEKKTEYVFEPVLLLDNGMELVKYQHPLLEVVFTEQVPKEAKIDIEGIYKIHLNNLNKGLAIIAENNPENYTLLLKNVKKVMLFNAAQPNSFAVMKAHNMIFLNVNVWDSEMFFADHISHEGGHVIFNTLTYESKFEMFNCHHNTNFSEVTGVEREHSSVYLRFHALFSYLEITKCIESCINNNALSKRNVHEAKGRYVFHVFRFKLAIESFEKINVFKEEGLAWFNFFKKHYRTLEEKYNELETMYVLDDQPYDFNSSIFEKRNPLQAINS